MREIVKAIFPVIVLLLVILSIVAVGFIMYFKTVKIKDESARKIEIMGYYLLIVLIVWEFGIKNIAMGDFYNLDIYVIEQKLDTMFRWLQQRINNDIDSNKIIPEYNAAGGEHIYVKYQMLFVDVVEMIMQVLSTICIAIGRFQELIKKKVKQKN